MKETEQLRTLMESVYTPIVENDDPEVRMLEEMAKIVEMGKAYYEGEGWDEDEVLEHLDEMFKAALGRVYGSEF